MGGEIRSGGVIQAHGPMHQACGTKQKQVRPRTKPERFSMFSTTTSTKRRSAVFARACDSAIRRRLAHGA